MTGLLVTSSGYWHPLAWLAVMALAVILALIIRSFGNNRFRKGTDQQVPFYSGNRAPEGRIKSSNLYWGFFTAMEKYFRWLRRLHTGIVNDYVYWFVLVMVIMLAAVMLGGGP